MEELVVVPSDLQKALLTAQSTIFSAPIDFSYIVLQPATRRPNNGPVAHGFFKGRLQRLGWEEFSDDQNRALLDLRKIYRSHILQYRSITIHAAGFFVAYRPRHKHPIRYGLQALPASSYGGKIRPWKDVCQYLSSFQGLQEGIYAFPSPQSSQHEKLAFAQHCPGLADLPKGLSSYPYHHVVVQNGAVALVGQDHDTTTALLGMIPCQAKACPGTTTRLS